VKQLLDTHTFLWFVMGNPKITMKLRSQIENNDNFLSIVSVGEIAIKYGIGKLSLNLQSQAKNSTLWSGRTRKIPILRRSRHRQTNPTDTK
jgi:PIN domain nuclease of toxin-antitoxin system